MSSDVRFTATAADRQDYVTWFTSSGGSLATNAISLEGARGFFLQSGQPNEVLSSVWRLANRAGLPEGRLNLPDFCIAANLLVQISRRMLPGPPASLPREFGDAADAFARPALPGAAPPAPAPTAFDPFPSSAPAPSTAGSSLLDFGGPSGGSPMRPLDVQRTGGSSMGGSAMGGYGGGVASHRTGSTPMSASPARLPPTAARTPSTPLASGLGYPPLSAAPSSPAPVEWAVPADRQATYAGYFAQVDVTGRGRATGAECHPMFSQSGLPGDDLARIWTLVCTNPAGLDRDEFVLAMYLIFERLAKKPIPATLTPELVPPSARRSGTAAGAPPPVVPRHPASTGPDMSDMRSGGGMPRQDANASTLSLSSLHGNPSSGGGGKPSAAPLPPSTSSSGLRSFEDIIGGGGGGPAAGSGSPMGGHTSGTASPPNRPAGGSAFGGVGGFGGLGSGVGSSAPTSATLFGHSTGGSGISTIPRGGPTGGPGSYGSSSMMPTMGLLSGTAMSQLPASALPEARDLNELVGKTEILSMQRIETTTQLNAVSIEAQNLRIRLGQAKATHDAEETLLEEMKKALEQEKLHVADLQQQLVAAEEARDAMRAEKQTLTDEGRAARAETDQLRSKLVSLNLEIAGMRQELAALRDEHKRAKDDREMAGWTAQNVEDSKSMVALQLDQERAARPAVPAAFAASPSVLPPIQQQRSSTMSPVLAAASPMPATRPLSAASFSAIAAVSPTSSIPARAGSVRSIHDPASPMGIASAASPIARAASVRSVDAIGSPASKAASLAGAAFPSLASPPMPPAAPFTAASPVPSASAFAAVVSPMTTPVVMAAPAPATSAVSPMLTTVSPRAVPADFDAFDMSAFPPISQITGTASPAISPAPPAQQQQPPATPAIPDAFAREFDGGFDFPVAPAGAPAPSAAASIDPFAAFGGPSGGGGSAPASATDAFDPFSAFGGGAPAAPMAAPSSAPTSAVATGSVDAFDPFAAFGASPAAPAAPVAAPMAPSSDPFGFATTTTGTDGAAPVVPPSRPVRTPSPAGADPIATVMAMGFSKEQALEALERYDFDAEKALNYLFDASS